MGGGSSNPVTVKNENVNITPHVSGDANITTGGIKAGLLNLCSGWECNQS